MQKIAIYIRVSTQEQAKEGYSISEQTERLTKYVQAHGWIIYKIYTDAGCSGANQNRPSLQQMITDVKSGKINKVLVYKLDRLSRSQKDTLELIEDVFLKNNCDFESMTERFDTSTSFGKAMVGILAVFAQLEREQIKERMSLGMEARWKDGKWHGSNNVPFGYTYKPEDGHLTVNPYEAMIIKELFNQFASGKKLRQICREFMDKGYTLRNGSIEPRAVRYMLSNKTYCGYLRYKKDNWIKSTHEAIIDESTYNDVQKILERNRSADKAINSHNYGNKNHTTYLGGMLYCAHCGAKYGKILSGHKQYGYKDVYSCYSRSKKMKTMIIDPNCKNKNYDAAVLDKLVFDEVKKLSLDPDYIFHNNPVTDTKPIEDQIKNIDNQISRLIDLYSIGKFDVSTLDDKIASLTDQKMKLTPQLNTNTMPAEAVTALVTSFEDVLNNGTMEDVRTILEQLINRIEIDNDNITIHWNFN